MVDKFVLHSPFPYPFHSLLKFICRITLVWGWAVGPEEAAHSVVIVVAIVLLAGDLGSWGRYIWRQNLFCFLNDFLS